VPFSPIFIVGVPRSGTTLLRVLLDSHSQILALPETPWVSGAYGGPLSLRQLLLDLADGPYGAARNVAGVERKHILAAGAQFLEQLLEPALKARDKSVLAFKTPSDIPHLEFLVDLLPDAHYIHITRDGRDVAMSQLSKKGSFFLELRGYRRLSYANVFRRWMEWEKKARAVLYRGNLKVLHLRYEDLVADPGKEMQRAMSFVGLPFEASMLDYAAQSHDFPEWEAGSTDVVQRKVLSASSVEKWRKSKMSLEVLHTLTRHDKFLVNLGYASSDIRPRYGQGPMIAAYGVVQPVLDLISVVARKVRPLVRDRRRLFACLCLLLLAIQSLVPARMPGPSALTSDMLGALLCFGATLSFAAAFHMVLRRRSSGAGSVLARLGLMMLAYVAALESVHALASGRQPTLEHVSLNLFALFAALVVIMPIILLQSRRQRGLSGVHP
jgi:hypothetical protein